MPILPVLFREREWPDDLEGINSGGIAGIGEPRVEAGLEANLFQSAYRVLVELCQFLDRGPDSGARAGRLWGGYGCRILRGYELASQAGDCANTNANTYPSFI